MKIIADTLSFSDLKKLATDRFGDMVKAVVDIDLEIIALDAELHSDLEAALLENGSSQKNIWGINLYPEFSGDDFVEFDSMINVRPSQGNRSREVEDKEIQNKIIQIIDLRIER